jgi:high-affinity iron transporter
VTGVLGIPADPRVIEVLAWFLYLIPVLLIVLWPASLKPRGRTVPRVQFGIAGGLAVAAVVLAIAVPASAAVALPASAPIVGASGSEIGTASANVGASGAVVTARHGSTQTIRFTKTQMSEGERGGVAAEHWQKSQSVKSASRPATVSLTELIRLNGGRIPVGVDAQQNPGPYSAAWTTRSSDSAWTVDGRLLDATTASTTILTISRGGLPYPRTLTLTPSADASNWRVEPSFVAKATAAHASSAASGSELMLWKLWLPLVLGIGAVILAGFGVRGMRRLARDESRTPSPATTPVTPRSTSYAAK